MAEVYAYTHSPCVGWCACVVGAWDVAPSGAAQDRAVPPLRLGDTRLARTRDVLGGQRAVRCAETQGEGEGPVTLRHLGTDVDIEEPDVLTELPCSRAQGVGNIGDRHRVGDHQGHILLGHGLRRDVRSRCDLVGRGDEPIEVDLERAGARWQ